jgi:hypothetical protein
MQLMGKPQYGFEVREKDLEALNPSSPYFSLNFIISCI